MSRKQLTDLDFNSASRVLNLPTPSNAGDAATKTYVDAADATKANKAGDTFAGSVQVGASGTNGYMRANPGVANVPGYIEFFTQEGTRRGYIGYASGANLVMSSENGWNYLFLQRPSFNGATPWDSANLTQPMTLNTVQTVTGAKYFNGYTILFHGAVGSQEGFLSMGWNNNVVRWSHVLETDSSYSLYSYDTSAGTPTQSLNIKSAVAGGVNTATFNGNVSASGKFTSGSTGIHLFGPGAGLRSSATNEAVLSTQAAGVIYLRPNGDGSASGQVTIGSAGELTVPTVYISNSNGAYINGNGAGIVVNGGLYNATRPYVLSANGAAWIDQARTFVTSGDPGAQAADGDLWIW